MSDYTKSKDGIGGQLLEGDVDSAWTRVEPLITPDILQARWLFGIPLVSGMPNPMTRKVDVMTPHLLKDIIETAIAELETGIGIKIFATRMKQRLPFDKNEFESYGYFRLYERPISSVQSLRIESSDGIAFFEMPLEWVEAGHLHYGQINILPLSPASTSSNAPSGLVFMQLMRGMQWIPAYWMVEYTAGYPDDMFPRIINDLIGQQTAINVLSMLGATFARSNSTSLGIDGMSQSVSTPGPDLFASRIKDLETKKLQLINRVKKKLGLGIIVGNV